MAHVSGIAVCAFIEGLLSHSLHSSIFAARWRNNNSSLLYPTKKKKRRKLPGFKSWIATNNTAALSVKPGG